MSIQKVEMTVEQIENGQYVEQVVYPFVEYDHVAMENGMDIMSMIRDDVSTPIVTHNTTSWKVGQGDSDVSETIVDSSVASMTIKGQTYQNILPEPSLRNSMTNGKTMQKLNEGYDSVNTVDGVCKSAILLGQTLVNLVEPNGHIYFESTTLNKEKDFKSTHIKPNTTYTAFFNFLNPIKTQDKVMIGVVNEYGSSWVSSLSTHYGNDTVCKTNLKFTTSSNANSGCSFRIRYDSLRGGQSETPKNDLNIELVILEGDYTNVDIPYFEGMQSVKMPVLSTTGKNLWGEHIWEEWSKSPVTNGHIVTGFKPNCKYTVSVSKIIVPVGIYYRFSIGGGYLLTYDNRKGLEPYVITNLSRTFSTDENGGFRLGDYFNSKSNIEIFKNSVENLQLEENSINTTYEPYKSNILSCNEEVTLRGIGDVKDELNLLTGELTQRIEYTEDFISYFKIRSFNRGFTLNEDYHLGSIASVYLSDSLVVKPSNSTSLVLGNSFSVSIGGKSEDIIIQFDAFNDWVTLKFKNGFLTKKGYSEDEKGALLFLKENPIKCLMKLKTPTVKTVDLSILNQDNQSIKQLNSFANGYIQVSSQEGALIPTTEYEVPTSNSYHVDLMKANTQYTMKNMQGAFTIDGIQYNASVNGTFTSPSTLSNRLMITNVVQTQPMLLEGDMTNKEVSYVEGIKSAFEGVDNVEIVSQNADNSLSNITSFQLAHPLRSLPNGVRDEIVLDRQNHKARIIQRVGEDLTQLDTPIVTEVNLEGYPYVYKGGHIFLNTEIAPTTEVTYSINQAHQIESSNEDILRHQKEINHLYELIAQYVQVQYEAELIDIALQG